MLKIIPWKESILELFTEFLVPLEGVWDPFGWSSVIDQSFRLKMMFLDSQYAFVLQGTLEAAHWVLILELDPNNFFTPSDSGSWPLVVTGETLREAFQQMHEAVADLKAESRQG